MTTKITYKVHAEGWNVKESDTIFTSLKEAKEYMKSMYEFYKRMDASLFTLNKIETTGNDYDATQINTRTTIFNM